MSSLMVDRSNPAALVSVVVLMRSVDARELVLTSVTGPDQWERYISADGLHPNEVGYGVMADALAAELRTLVG